MRSSKTLKTGDICGGMTELSPFLCRRKSYTNKVDVYAFGITAAELLRGCQPFESFSKESEFTYYVCHRNLRSVHSLRGWYRVSSV